MHIFKIILWLCVCAIKSFSEVSHTFFCRNWCKHPAQLFSFEKNFCLKKTKWNSTAMLLLKKCLFLFKIFQFSKNTSQLRDKSKAPLILLVSSHNTGNKTLEVDGADSRIAVPSHSQDFSATLCLCLKALGIQNSKKTHFMDIQVSQ